MTNKDWLWVSAFISVWSAIYFFRDNVAEVGSYLMKKFTRSQFVSEFGPYARSASLGTGLFPSVTMAQAILESGDGNSSLSQKGLNFFGIKADQSWSGPFVTMPTKEYINGVAKTVDAKFRAYATPYESFLDHAKFLKNFSRYKIALVQPTPELQAQALQTAGYATDPAYSNKLISLINSNNLKQFDV